MSFSVKKNAVSACRNRGYADGMAGRSARSPEGVAAEAKSAYFAGYWRGVESRVAELVRAKEEEAKR